MNTPSNASAAPVRLSRVLLVVIVLFAFGLVAGFIPRWFARQKLLAETKVDTVPTVTVALPTPDKSSAGTPLPADVQPFMQAAIHARASGYLKSWFVDIGDHVTNNQTLAEIDTPELDEQILQLRAELDQAIATRDLAKITSDRWVELLKTASVSDQETEEKKSDYVLKQANVEAARAALQRSEDLKKFDRVTAPFDGVVTARNTDIGQLISADSGAELFRLAQTTPLRVYVRVPQSLSHMVAQGQKAALTFQEMPGHEFEATVTRISGAEDSTSRTLQVELQVPNSKGEIFAGSYAQVRFQEIADANVLNVTGNALIFRAQGMQVAVLGPDNRAQLRSIKLGRDFGSTVEVLGGLNATDRVILNPPDSIADGMPVRLATTTTNTLQ